MKAGIGLDNRQRWAEAYRVHRLRRGATRVQDAEAAGVSEAVIIRLEHAQPIRRASRRAVEAAIGIELDQLAAAYALPPLDQLKAPFEGERAEG